MLKIVAILVVTTKLDFIKPFEGHNIAELTLEPQGGSTNVTWVMSGPSPYFSKVLGIFLNMDRLIGKDFETGLANLKTVAEKVSNDMYYEPGLGSGRSHG